MMRGQMPSASMQAALCPTVPPGYTCRGPVWFSAGERRGRSIGRCGTVATVGIFWPGRCIRRAVLSSDSARVPSRTGAGCEGAAAEWGSPMDASAMFLDCPAYMDKSGSVRCGLPAAVEDRYLMRSTDGPLESARIRCPRGHWFNGPVESLTLEERPDAPVACEAAECEAIARMKGAAVRRPGP